MTSRSVHQLESRQAAEALLETLPAELDEALAIGDLSRRRRIDHVVLGGGRREAKEIGEPARIESGGLAEAIAVATYGAAMTRRPSSSAGRISQRSRNARSAA